MSAALRFASRSAPDWQAGVAHNARSDADFAVPARARLYMEVPS